MAKTPKSKTNKTTKSKKSMTLSKPMAKAVGKICDKKIAGKIENKAWFDYGANNTITCVQSASPVARNLVPILTQGVGHTGRLGNECVVKNGYIRGHVNLLGYNATTNNLPGPIYVKMWLVSCINVNSNSVAVTGIGSDFFDIVNSTVGFQGNMLDMSLTVNKSAWRLYASKTIKLGTSFVQVAGNVVQGSTIADNSPMSAPFSFSFGKHLKKLKYDDNFTVAENRNLFLLFQTVYANGADSTGQILAEYHYTTRVEYEDA